MADDDLYGDMEFDYSHNDEEDDDRFRRDQLEDVPELPAAAPQVGLPPGSSSAIPQAPRPALTGWISSAPAAPEPPAPASGASPPSGSGAPPAVSSDYTQGGHYGSGIGVGFGNKPIARSATGQRSRHIHDRRQYQIPPGQTHLTFKDWRTIQLTGIPKHITHHDVAAWLKEKDTFIVQMELEKDLENNNGDYQKATCQLGSNEQANRLFRSPEPILNNRFIRLSILRYNLKQGIPEQDPLSSDEEDNDDVNRNGHASGEGVKEEGWEATSESFKAKKAQEAEVLKSGGPSEYGGYNDYSGGYGGYYDDYSGGYGGRGRGRGGGGGRVGSLEFGW